MIGLFIILAIGAVGIFILKQSFRQLTIIKVLHQTMNWRQKILRGFICLLGLVIGSVLALLFIFIPAAYGVDMDVALFAFIFGMPFFAYQALSANKL